MHRTQLLRSLQALFTEAAKSCPTCDWSQWIPEEEIAQRETLWQGGMMCEVFSLLEGREFVTE